MNHTTRLRVRRLRRIKRASELLANGIRLNEAVEIMRRNTRVSRKTALDYVEQASSRVYSMPLPDAIADIADLIEEEFSASPRVLRQRRLAALVSFAKGEKSE